jgi:hypothetical protein
MNAMNAKISEAIVTLIANGIGTEQAIDTVLGEGTYKRIAGEIWTAMREAEGLPTT